MNEMKVKAWKYNALPYRKFEENSEKKAAIFFYKSVKENIIISYQDYYYFLANWSFPR